MFNRKWKHSKTVLTSLTALSLLTIPTPSRAADDSIHIVIDGVEQTFDVAPYVKNDRTFIPLRGVLEKLGAQVFWNEQVQTVTIKKGDTFVNLAPDFEVASVNGASHALDVAPEIHNDRTMVPLRFLVETLGANVQWDDANHTVKITAAPTMTTTSKQFNMYINDLMPSVEPTLVPKDYDWNVIKQLYEGLVRTDALGKTVPGVAQSWESSADGLTWTFHLRGDAKWSDGTVVTADDFVSGWKHAIDINTEASKAFLFEGIKGVQNYLTGPGSLREIGIRAVDDRTLTVQLEQPMPWFPQMTADPIFSPHRGEFTKPTIADDLLNYKFTTLTNGPFQLKANVPIFDLQMEKSSTYWDREHVQLDAVHVQLMPFFADEYLETLYEGGALDQFPILYSQNDKLASHPDHLYVDSGSTTYLMYNESNPALKNTKIRRALGAVIDQTAFVNTVYGGNYKPATGFVPVGLSGNVRQHNGNLLQTANATAQAKRWLTEGLQELGLTQLPSLTITTETASESEDLLNYLTKQWKSELGIEVKPNVVSFSEKLEMNHFKRYDISINSWGADYDDPTTYLNLLQTGNIGNESGYSNPAYDALLKKASTESNVATREGLYAEAEKLALQDAPITPLLFKGKSLLVKPYVKGSLYAGIGYYMDLKNISVQGK